MMNSKTSRLRKLMLCKSILCICAVALLAGCSSTNEIVVMPENSKKFSDVHEDYQDLMDRFGFDKNFESNRDLPAYVRPTQ